MVSKAPCFHLELMPATIRSTPSLINQELRRRCKFCHPALRKTENLSLEREIARSTLSSKAKVQVLKSLSKSCPEDIRRSSWTSVKTDTIEHYISKEDWQILSHVLQTKLFIRATRVLTCQSSCLMVLKNV